MFSDRCNRRHSRVRRSRNDSSRHNPLCLTLDIWEIKKVYVWENVLDVFPVTQLSQ